MTKPSSFYNEITSITENRIKELIRHTDAIDARAALFPQASAYFRAHAMSVYLAWRDVTEGFHTVEDLKRLAMLADSNVLAIGEPGLCRAHGNSDVSCNIPARV
jgi:ABC-type amino acid transport substrate-binding protein